MDVIVNNAGIQHVSPVEEFPEERFRLIIALMLEAPFRLVRAALPHMYAGQWGRVVNISSVHGLRASAYKSAYVAAKHGLEGLSKTIALEGGPRGVTSNTICPAYVRTPLVEKQVADQARAHGIPESEVIEQDHAHRARRQATRRARGGSRPGRLPLRPVGCPSRTAPLSPSTAAGQRDNQGLARVAGVTRPGSCRQRSLRHGLTQGAGAQSGTRARSGTGSIQARCSIRHGSSLGRAGAGAWSCG